MDNSVEGSENAVGNVQVGQSRGEDVNDSTWLWQHDSAWIRLPTKFIMRHQSGCVRLARYYYWFFLMIIIVGFGSGACSLVAGRFVYIVPGVSAQFLLQALLMTLVGIPPGLFFFYLTLTGRKRFVIMRKKNLEIPVTEKSLLRFCVVCHYLVSSIRDSPGLRYVTGHVTTQHHCHDAQKKSLHTAPSPSTTSHILSLSEIFSVSCLFPENQNH